MAEQYNREYELRRVDVINEKVLKVEGRQEGHELLCAQRYMQIIKEMTEIRSETATQSRYGLYIAAVLFLLELGRATFPVMFDLLTKGR